MPPSGGEAIEKFLTRPFTDEVDVAREFRGIEDAKLSIEELELFDDFLKAIAMEQGKKAQDAVERIRETYSSSRLLVALPGAPFIGALIQSSIDGTWGGTGAAAGLASVVGVDAAGAALDKIKSVRAENVRKNAAQLSALIERELRERRLLKGGK